MSLDSEKAPWEQEPISLRRRHQITGVNVLRNLSEIGFASIGKIVS